MVRFAQAALPSGPKWLHIHSCQKHLLYLILYLRICQSFRNCVCNPFSWGSLNGALKWGLRVLVLNCPQLPTCVVIWWRKFPLQKGPKRPQMCTIADDFARDAERALKPPTLELYFCMKLVGVATQVVSEVAESYPCRINVEQGSHEMP